MTLRTGRWLRAVAFGLGTAIAPAALAITNIEVQTTGTRAGETTIRLYTPDNRPVPATPGNPHRFADLPAGTYWADIVVGGNVVGIRRPFTMDDGNYRMGADSDTGTISLFRTGDAPSPWALSSPRDLAPWEPARGTPRLSATVSWQQTELPTMTSGTLVPDGAGSEQSAVTSEREFTSPWFRVSMGQTPFGDVAFGYTEGDETTSHTEPAGGRNIGFVYYQPSSSGSLGLNAGPTGADFRVKTEFKAFDLSYTLPWPLHRSVQEAVESARYRSEIRPELLYSYQRTTWASATASTSIAGLSMDSNQRVKEQRFGIGLRGEHVRPFGSGWTGGITVRGALLYRDADLDSTQNNTCDAAGCPAGSTFTATNHDSDNGWTWGASIDASLDYAIAPKASLGLEAGYHYLDEAAVVRNPVSTINLDRPPHLDTGRVETWRLGVVLRYAF